MRRVLLSTRGYARRVAFRGLRRPVRWPCARTKEPMIAPVAWTRMYAAKAAKASGAKRKRAKGKANSGGDKEADADGGRRRNRRGEGDPNVNVWLCHNVTKTHGWDRTILKPFSIHIKKGAKIGLVGINGAGKSTLLRMLSGDDTDFEGSVRTLGGVRVGFLAQEPALKEDLTVMANLVDGLAPEKAEALTAYHQVVSEQQMMRERAEDAEHATGSAGGTSASTADSASLESQREAAEQRLRDVGAHDMYWRVHRAQQALRCPPVDAPVTGLSGGEKRRVALCRLLLTEPDALLLDEPTNHLDADSVAWLEHWLSRYKGTVVAVTHDRYFLDNVAGWILEIDRGDLLPFRGNYTEWLESRSTRLSLEEATDAAQAKAIARELEWVRKSPKARQAKSKARLAAYDKLVASRREHVYAPGTIRIPIGRPLGRGDVLKVRGLSQRVPSALPGASSRLLFGPLDLNVSPGAVLGVVGPNGVGKSTLLKAIIRAYEECEGRLWRCPESDATVLVGANVSLGYVSQARSELEPSASVYEAISQGEDMLPDGTDARSYVSTFAFQGTDQQKRVGDLSGGERNRVHLARMIRHAPNVLLLDEPTNDLDVEVLRSLEESLETFVGSAVIVSHDRWFLNRSCSHILAFEPQPLTSAVRKGEAPECNVVLWEGNYEAYLADRKRRMKASEVDAKALRRKI